MPWRPWQPGDPINPLGPEGPIPPGPLEPGGGIGPVVWVPEAGGGAKTVEPPPIDAPKPEPPKDPKLPDPDKPKKPKKPGSKSVGDIQGFLQALFGGLVGVGKIAGSLSGGGGGSRVDIPVVPPYQPADAGPDITPLLMALFQNQGGGTASPQPIQPLPSQTSSEDPGYAALRDRIMMGGY